MEYKFKYKRRFFWKTIKRVVGHKLEDEQDKMVVYKYDGGIYVIPRWSECYLHLGHDFFLKQKKDAEREAGQRVPTEVGEK